MATNNSINSSFANNADGFTLGGGATPRTLTLTAGNLSLSAGGSNTYTLPAATGTLMSRDSTDTVTNKSVDAASNTITNFPMGAVASIVGMTTGSTTSTTFVGLPSNANAVTFTKRYASTKLIVQINMSFFFTGSSDLIVAAVQIGGTDYPVAQMFKNEVGSGASISGVISVTGISAGSVTATTRVRVGAGTLNFGTTNSVGMSIIETY